MNKLKIKIDKKLSDRDVMEYCLNLYCSGYDPTLLLAFTALGRGWSIDDVLFMQKEMNEVKE